MPTSNKPTLKIVHVVSSLQIGGMEHFVVRLAAAQQKQGHQVSILALKQGALLEEIYRLGLSASVLSGNKFQRIVQTLIFFGKKSPDIIHSHNQTSLHYAHLGKRISQAPVVMTNHGQGMGSSRTPSISEWNKTDSIIAVSNAVADRMDRNLLGTKLETIYNGVEFAAPQRSREVVRAELGIEPNQIIGIMVARIDHLKGHETLIDALSQLQGRSIPLTMLIAGDGTMRIEREQQAADLGLTSNEVRFLGFRSDVPDLLAACDIFVLPSLTEGLPLSVLEAMSHGLPIIATPVGGIPELVLDHEHGILVPVQDSSALAEALASLVSNPSQREIMGTASTERIQAHFTYPRMLESYECLYNNLLTTH